MLLFPCMFMSYLTKKTLAFASLKQTKSQYRRKKLNAYSRVDVDVRPIFLFNRILPKHNVPRSKEDHSARNNGFQNITNMTTLQASCI